MESSVPVSRAKSYQTIKTRERRQRPQSGPIVLFDTRPGFERISRQIKNDTLRPPPPLF